MSGSRWVHRVCALALAGLACSHDTTSNENGQASETSDGDGDGDPGDGDGDGDPGDGDGDGDGDSDPGDGDGAPGDGDGDGDGDTGGDLTCDEIEVTYESLIASSTACDNDDQCHVVLGHCFVGLGGCWYVVNDSIDQTNLDDFATQFESQGCTGAVCFCAPPPAAIGCVNNTCEAL